MPVTTTEKTAELIADTKPYLSVNDYDYQLPDELIARYPLDVRSASRLLYLPSQMATLTTTLTTLPSDIQDLAFTELPDLLNAGDLIVFNDTKVMKARLHGQKDSGGKVEVLVERLIDDPALLKMPYKIRTTLKSIWRCAMCEPAKPQNLDNVYT